MFNIISGYFLVYNGKRALNVFIYPTIHLFPNLFHWLPFFMRHFIYDTVIVHIANTRFRFHLLLNIIHALRNHRRCPFHIKQSRFDKFR